MSVLLGYKPVRVTGHNTQNAKAPAKRLQKPNATYRNIVGRNMLHAFGHRVAMCWDMLGEW